MTITAVVTQYFDRYCESSNSPVFAHIWVSTAQAFVRNMMLIEYMPGPGNRVRGCHHRHVLRRAILYPAQGAACRT